jgi:hypothetical protein
MPRKQPTDEDRIDVVRITLRGLASGEDFDPILEKLQVLHVRHNTLPAEELLELAADAIDESGATTGDPIDFETIRERFLPEHPFSGKNQHYKSKYALSAAVMIHGGGYPDLLDDAAWWATDDLWIYSFFALLIFIRAAAERTGRSVEQIALSIADHRAVRVDPIEASEGEADTSSPSQRQGSLRARRLRTS